jgi:hypothetical protein
VIQAPVIDFPDFNTDSSQQSLARFIVENNLITLVPQQGAFIVNVKNRLNIIKDNFILYPMI